MDRAHRKELKHDKFVEQVGHTVEYAAGHKSQVVKIAAGVVVLLVAALGVYLYMGRQHAQRQADLHQAMRTIDAQIGPSSEFLVTYPTQEEKDKAVEKALTDVATKHSGKEEGMVARYLLGVQFADRGKLADSEKNLKIVADDGDDEIASQAKLSLAQLYESQNKVAEAEKLLQSIANDPTIFVSKWQATIALARLKAKSNPAEARKLLEPLRTASGAVSRVAINALGEIR